MDQPHPFWIFLLLTLGVLGWSVHDVPWETRYRSPDGSHSCGIVPEPSPLWAPPPEMTLAEFRAAWGNKDARARILDSGRVETVINWEMALTSIAALWVIFGGLLWPVFRLGARWEPSWARAAGFSLGLLAGSVGCLVLWLVLGGWGPPAIPLFALGGGFLGWHWSRRASLACES